MLNTTYELHIESTALVMNDSKNNGYDTWPVNGPKAYADYLAALAESVGYRAEVREHVFKIDDTF